MNSYLVVFAVAFVFGIVVALGVVIGARRAGHRLRPRRPPHRPHAACCYLPDTGQVPLQHQRRRSPDWRGALS